MHNNEHRGKQNPSWDSVDTVIRDEGPAPQPARQSLRVVSFSNGIEPATIPTGAIQVEDSRDISQDEPAPAAHAASAQRFAQSASFEVPAPVNRGKIICVFGCRGGSGATMLAVNVASALSKGGKSVVVVDLDLQLGDVFVALDLDAPTSLAALSREVKQLDGAGLRRRLVRHDSGVYALSQTGRLDDIDDNLAERLPGLLGSLAEHFDYVVVDGVRDFGDCALAALDAADKIAMVVTQDVQAVRRASRVAQLFRRLNYADRKIHLVLNRHTSKATVDEKEIERVIGLPVTATVRNDYLRLRKALDEGSLLHDTARGSGVHRDVELVARTLLSDPTSRSAEASHDDEPGFFARLFGRR
jgi:pilus assembly protein CpaE